MTYPIWQTRKHGREAERFVRRDVTGPGVALYEPPQTFQETHSPVSAKCPRDILIRTVLRQASLFMLRLRLLERLVTRLTLSYFGGEIQRSCLDAFTLSPPPFPSQNVSASNSREIALAFTRPGPRCMPRRRGIIRKDRQRKAGGIGLAVESCKGRHRETKCGEGMLHSWAIELVLNDV